MSPTQRQGAVNTAKLLRLGVENIDDIANMSLERANNVRRRIVGNANPEIISLSQRAGTPLRELLRAIEAQILRHR